MIARRTALTLALAAAAAGPAAADKAADKPAKPADKPAKPADKPAEAVARPTPAQAMQAAKAWIDALDGDKADAAAPHTASSLYALANGLTGATCKETTATTPGAIGKLLACLQGEVKDATDLLPWKKGADDSFGPLVKPLRAKLPALERTSTLVYMHEKCVGEGRDVVIAVALEKGKPRVSAVMSWHWSCGE